MNATLTKSEAIQKELFLELENIERDLSNLEDRREEIYKRIDSLNEQG